MIFRVVATMGVIWVIKIPRDVIILQLMLQKCKNYCYIYNILEWKFVYGIVHYAERDYLEGVSEQRTSSFY